MIWERSIGERICNHRKARKMTLQDLAAATSLSKGYLSKLEATSKAPPIPTLVRIAEALSTPPSLLLGEQPCRGNISFVKKSERIPVALNGTDHGCRYEAIAYRYLGRHMQPFILILPTGNEEPKTLFQHDTEELLFVLHGIIKLFHGNRYYRLKEGDCVYFHGKVPHYAQSEGEDPAVCLMIQHTR